MAGRVDPFHAESDDLVLKFDEHAVEGLLVALAEFRLQCFESGDGAQGGQEFFYSRSLSGDEEIDPLRTKQNAPFEPEPVAFLLQPYAEFRKSGQFRKFVCSSIEDRHEGMLLEV